MDVDECTEDGGEYRCLGDEELEMSVERESSDGFRKQQPAAHARF